MKKIFAFIPLTALLSAPVGARGVRPESQDGAPAVQRVERQFKVEHVRLWRNQQGILRINDSGFRYESHDGKDQRAWKFDEIQQLKLKPQGIEMLSYKDQKWQFGRDKMDRFRILEGTVDARTSEFLREQIAGIFVTAILPEPSVQPAYQVPVKHLRAGQGSIGLLEIYDDRILYRSEAADSRSWTYSQITAFAIPSKRELELVTDEKKLGGPGRTFRFQAREAIAESIYDYLWVRLYGSSYYPREKRSGADAETTGPPHCCSEESTATRCV